MVETLCGPPNKAPLVYKTSCGISTEPVFVSPNMEAAISSTGNIIHCSIQRKN